MKILFHTPQIDVRGTCVSLYDYAHYHETLLGGQSVIITPYMANHDSDAIFKFIKRFQVIYYNTIDQIENIAKDFDIFYAIKYGKKDDIICKNTKTVIHCVFDLSEPHGNVYAAVSNTLAKKFGSTIFVPHMIGLKPSRTNENLRKMLNVPENAVVFGRHGGQDTFDLDIAKKAIINAVNFRSDLYFIFVNTPRFYDHPRIHHLNKIVDLDEKNRFIMSCDAHLECGSLGHTFGISIGEFSINNKPIIAYNGPVWNTAHFDILKDKGIYFKNEEELYYILINFNSEYYKKIDNNCYTEYTPEKVMQKFQEVFMN